MKKLVSLVVGLILAASTGANAADDPRGTLGEILKAKKIVIMNDLSAAPWQFRDANGNPAGFSVDLDRLIASKLDVDLEMRNVEWAGLIPGLLSRKSDILATSMSMTYKRAEQVLFTTGNWYSTGVVAAVKPENNGKSWEDLNQSGKRIAVKAGTTAVDAAKQFFANAETQSYPNDVDTYQALKTGRVDAVLADNAVLGAIKADYGFEALAVPRQLITSDTWGFAVRPGDFYMWQYLNFFLAQINKSGELDALNKYWAQGDTWKKDFLETNGGVSDERKKLVELLGIGAYVSEGGKASRLTLE
ncbi:MULTISPECIES: ABC transporter substrate-binding protein [unclassified Rhizobium]|uniref:ABC transporter substrate-binding protein n=1 Tax=unclassified Rhizobium TaxID=2613769 RepID=UPI001ADB3E7D|nr:MULTISPECIES: ABC transporter substrate-binding protein [unclassified Rhizobium]MBO9127714.1 amino acid ABC transporter substrate-binding protein [Rhizobium sp. 16-488-2b]MBO9178176.1 amino acid ABC transporter substrate-binding protein [Rhizobium sp. 16-488-2a]